MVGVTFFSTDTLLLLFWSGGEGVKFGVLHHGLLSFVIHSLKSCGVCHGKCLSSVISVVFVLFECHICVMSLQLSVHVQPNPAVLCIQ